MVLAAAAPAVEEVSYEIVLGDLRIASGDRQGARLLVRLASDRSLGGIPGRCTIDLAPSDRALPDPGERGLVTIGRGRSVRTVFTGLVAALHVTEGRVRVELDGPFAALARSEHCAAYEEATADEIANELLSGRARAGRIDPGPTFPRYIVHRTPSVLAHLRRLAERTGAELWSDGDGQVHLGALEPGLHTFEYASTVLDYSLRRARLPRREVIVRGDGAAGSQGASRGHWLVTGRDAVTARSTLESETEPAGDTRTVADAALRSQRAADEAARAHADRLARLELTGTITVFGTSAVEPGDRIRIQGVPETGPLAGILDAAGPLTARRVRHTLDIATGYRTRIDA